MPHPRRRPFLVIFEECESAEALAPWRPPPEAGRVLMMRRRAGWAPGMGQTLALGVPVRAESIGFLRWTMERPNDL